MGRGVAALTTWERGAACGLHQVSREAALICSLPLPEAKFESVGIDAVEVVAFQALVADEAELLV
jgi:hypothetical protein